MTWPLLRSRTLTVPRLHDDGCAGEFRGQRGGIAEVDRAPVAIVQAVRSPAWERGCSGTDDHAFAFRVRSLRVCRIHALVVDVAFGAQTGEGVVEVWGEPEQQGFIFLDIRRTKVKKGSLSGPPSLRPMKRAR